MQTTTVQKPVQTPATELEAPGRITIAAVSHDKTRVLAVPDGDMTRGVWIDLGQDLAEVKFPLPALPTPKYRQAAWGEGKGVKGGFSGLRGTK